MVSCDTHLHDLEEPGVLPVQGLDVLDGVSGESIVVEKLLIHEAPEVCHGRNVDQADQVCSPGVNGCLELHELCSIRIPNTHCFQP